MLFFLREQILKRDKDALKNAPKVMLDQLRSPSSRSRSRSYSTSARLAAQDMQESSPADEKDAKLGEVVRMIANAERGVIKHEERVGYKFDMPKLPLPKSENVKRRYDPLVEQFTKLMMTDGKLSRAQNVCFLPSRSPRESMTTRGLKKGGPTQYNFPT